MSAYGENGIEDVWRYPRPPAIEPVNQPIEIDFGGQLIACTTAALRVLETTHPPVYYLPQASFRDCELLPVAGESFCEWKGLARYWSIRSGAKIAQHCSWSYPTPSLAYAALRDCLAVYAGAMDACRVGGETVTPQPGGFYGGWVTKNLKGPFKGVPGSNFWYRPWSRFRLSDQLCGAGAGGGAAF